MSKAKRSWREKLQDNKDLPKVIRPKGKGATRYGERMLVPAPMEVDKLMRGVRKGRVVTVGNLREKLAGGSCDGQRLSAHDGDLCLGLLARGVRGGGGRAQARHAVVADAEGQG